VQVITIRQQPQCQLWLSLSKTHWDPILRADIKQSQTQKCAWILHRITFIPFLSPIVYLQSVVEFLDKSRSAISRTHTTSSAPAPALAPATIAFSDASSKIIDSILHSEGTSPSTLLYMNARDDASLQVLAKALVPFLTSRQQALEVTSLRQHLAPRRFLRKRKLSGKTRRPRRRHCWIL
jgi:hypothetical protein